MVVYTTGDKPRYLADKSWKVKKVTAENNTATVEIELTNKDFSEVFHNFEQANSSKSNKSIKGVKHEFPDR